MIEKAKAFAKAIFAGDGSGHDFDHTMRVYRMAMRIASEEGADAQIVGLAALLHDVDDHKLSPDTCKEMNRAADFLRNNNVPEDRVQRVLQIISEISFSAGKGRPTTIEGMCVQDADRLDAMGAIGIGRAFAFGGSRGRRMHDPENVDITTTIQHFYDKLLRLMDLMNTKTGRKLALQRDQYMRQFLDEFYAEWDGQK